MVVDPLTKNFAGYLLLKKITGTTMRLNFYRINLLFRQGPRIQRCIACRSPITGRLFNMGGIGRWSGIAVNGFTPAGGVLR